MNIELGGKSHAVNLPKRHAERRELAGTFGSSNLRGAAALLALTVPALDMLARPGNVEGLDPSRYRCDWYEFGADALEVLIGRGHTEQAIVTAAEPIFLAICDLLPDLKAAIEKSRDFSKATGESSIS